MKSRSVQPQKSSIPVSNQATVGSGEQISFNKSASAKQAARFLLSLEGGCVSTSEAAQLFRPDNPIAPREIRDQIHQKQIIAVRSGARRSFRIPRWQFRIEGGLIDGLEETYHILLDRDPYFSELTPFLFFLQPNALTKLDTPLKALRMGRIKEVKEAATARSFA